MSKKIIGIGHALVDVVTRVSDDSLLKKMGFIKGSMNHVDASTSEEIGKLLHDSDSIMAPGGSGANTIHGLGKMGIETEFLCRTGADKVGRFFEDSMREVGVKPIVVNSPNPSGLVRAIVTPDGERTFATCVGAASELSADFLKASMFRGCSFCYLEGYLITNRELFAKAIALAKQVKAKVVLDLASFNIVEENRDFLINLLPSIDIVFANEDEAKALTKLSPEEALNFIAEKVEIAIVKLGKDGSIIRRGDEIVRVEAIPTNAIDTTGAGDLYAAGFLYALIENKPLAECGRYGSVLAHHIIQVYGAKLNAEHWEKIYKELGIDVSPKK